MTVRLALATSGAARLLAVAAVAGIAGGGYTLACMTSGGANDSQINAAALVDRTSQPDRSDIDDPSSSSAVNAPVAVTSTHDESSPEATPESTPTPSLRGLCTAFRAHHLDSPDHWQHSAAFQVLIKAAGGSDLTAVNAFCAALAPAARSSEDASEDASEEASEHAWRSHTPEPFPTRTDEDTDASGVPDSDGPRLPRPAPTGTWTRSEWQPMDGTRFHH